MSNYNTLKKPKVNLQYSFVNPDKLHAKATQE